MANKNKKSSGAGAAASDRGRSSASSAGAVTEKPGDRGGNTAVMREDRKGKNETTDVERRIEALEGKLKQLADNEQSEAEMSTLTVEQRLESVERLVAQISEKRKKVTHNETRWKDLQRATLCENVTSEETFERFYSATFASDNERMATNPYALRRKITEVTGRPPRRITSARNSFHIEVRDAMQGSKLVDITHIGQIKCHMAPHPTFNQSRGIIYIHDFDIYDIEQFKTNLKSNYNIAEVLKATFIKTRNDQTSAFLVTFNQERVPDTIYIPGERADTRVYQYNARPLMCKNCQGYGHTAKWCRNPTRCRKCADEDHSEQQCESNIFRCYHCQLQHKSGDRACEKHIQETKITEYQEKERVSRLRAMQMLNGQEVIQLNKGKYATHFRCEMDSTKKRRLNPWLLEKCLQEKIGQKPKSIRAESSTNFVIEVQDRQQSEIMESLQSINGIAVKIYKHPNYNTSKGILNVYDYNMQDFETYKEFLKEEIGAREIEEATWIKSRNTRATPLIVTFNQIDPPEYVNITGERAYTRVRRYIPSPMRCKRCQEYGHTRKNCGGAEVCGKCSGIGHDLAKCENEEVKCHHCKLDHLTGDRRCTYQLYEKEILAISATENVSKNQARVILNNRNPNFKLNYARAAGQRSIVAMEAVAATDRGLRENHLYGETREAVNSERQSTDSRKRKISNEESENATQRMKYIMKEAVCISPSSGSVFTTTVEVPDNGSTPANKPSTPTSENDAAVREEVRKIFENEGRDGKVADDVQMDLDQYERDLHRRCDRKTAGRNRRWSVTESNKRRDGEQSARNKSKEDTRRKEIRAPKLSSSQ